MGEPRSQISHADEDRKTHPVGKAKPLVVHSPLTRAVARDDFKAVDTLISSSSATIDVNWRGEIYGNTALHWAVANSNTRMALHLLEKLINIDVNIQDLQGKTALHLAIGKGWSHFTDNVEKDTQREPPQAPVIQTLIEKTQVDIVDEKGNTPLHIAIMRRDVNCVELLVERKADLTIRNKNGETPIDMLKMNYNQVRNFIKDYVVVFTLEEEIWSQNGKTINELLGKKINNEEKEDKDDTPKKLAIPAEQIGGISQRVEQTPEGPEEKASEPAAAAEFDQAIRYLQNFIDIPNCQLIYPEIHANITLFNGKIALLKNETISRLNDDKISVEDAKILATQSLILAQKVANLTLNENDITAFRSATAAYRATPCFGKLLGAIIGAAIGVFFGVMAGMAAGPTAAFTGLYGGAKGAVIGASIGGALGGAFGFWASKKYLEPWQTLAELEDVATEEIRILDCK